MIFRMLLLQKCWEIWQRFLLSAGVYILFENSYTFHNFSLKLPPSKKMFCPSGLIVKLQPLVGRSDVGMIGRFEGGKARRSEGGKVWRSEGGKVGRLEGWRFERLKVGGWKGWRSKPKPHGSLYLPQFLPYTFHTKIFCFCFTMLVLHHVLQFLTEGLFRSQRQRDMTWQGRLVRQILRIRI